MNYSTRNSFYLRISQNIVLPIYVYLDERHVNWMSDKVLQHVLSDLRPHILPKLKAEADGLTGGPLALKNTTVDTHRGEFYQFCYFIRKTEPHSVVIKTRHFRAAPTKTSSRPATIPSATSSKKRGKRKESSSTDNTTSKKRKMNEQQLVDEGDISMTGDQSANANEARENAPPIELEIEEEEKPKPILGLNYQGFKIYGQCLCVVVEPWPVVRSTTVAPLFAQAASSTRAQTPLFLPEDPEDADTRHRSDVPRRSNINQSYLNQVLNDNNVSDASDEDDAGGMLEFSQVLHSIGDNRAGAVNDDDDIDGSILFGDADEFKEL